MFKGQSIGTTEDGLEREMLNRTCSGAEPSAENDQDAENSISSSSILSGNRTLNTNEASLEEGVAVVDSSAAARPLSSVLVRDQGPTKEVEMPLFRPQHNFPTPLIRDNTPFSLTSSSTPIAELDWLDDASLLANNLTEIVNSKLDELGSWDKRRGANSFENDDTITISTLSPDSQIQRDLPLGYLKLKGQHLFYLKEFYYNFSQIMLPYTAYVDGQEINPLRDLLLQYARESFYLLYAMLAGGARMSFRKTTLQEDEDSYVSYLNSCLGELSKDMDQNLMTKMDSILLTILVLTTDNASSKVQKWRAHLSGARDLLLKYSYRSHEWRSVTMATCRCWFSSIEILAALSSSSGGTLRTGEELDLVLRPYDEFEELSLKQANLILENGFSLFHGYSVDLLSLLKDLIKLSQMETSHEYSQASKLLGNLHNQLNFEMVCREGIIPEGHPFHPKTGSRGTASRQLPSSAVELIKTHSDQEIACSWYDLSHRAYTLAAIIHLFTKCLGIKRESDVVQSALRDIIALMVVLDGVSLKNPQCLFLLQWPMLVAGYNSLKQDHRLKVETFFRILAQLGSGSAGFVLTRMRKAWSMKQALSSDSSELDIVTY